MEYTEILSMLKGVKGHGDQYTAQCPAHDDNHNSLSICRGNEGRTLLKCHAGCSIENIVTALGLKIGDLQPPKCTENKIVATYGFTDESGAEVFQKMSLRRLMWVIPTR